MLSGVTGELVDYTYRTNPGSLPGGTLAAWVGIWIWPVMFATLPFLALLFSDGRVPGPRWRFLPPTILATAAVAILGQILAPGPIPDLPVRIENPTGVEALRGVVDGLGLGWLGLFGAAAASIAALFVRYRRSAGEQRQQIRWLAYVAATIVALVLLGLATGLIVGPSFGESALSSFFFLSVVALIGIGVPIAIGVAVLKYRLYELDVVIRKTVVFGILVVLIMAVALGLLLALSDPLTAVFPDETQAVGIVGVAIGLLVWPLRRLAVRIADRVVFGGRASPYEVLTDLAERVGGTYSTEDVLPRMAEILAGATRAERATVWLKVGDELRPEAATGDRFPAPVRLRGDGLPAFAGGEDAFEVRHQGELLGALSVTMPASDPMNPSKDKLIRDLASQAGLVLRNVRLIEELRASRRRIVAAQDERAKTLERNIHDGAQQQLVALSVKLRLAEGAAPQEGAERTRSLLGQLQEEANDALENLRDLARGLYPPLLAEEGLPAALEAQARKAPVPVEVDPDSVGRYPQEIESAVYFCVLEALQNVAKYANATKARVRLQAGDGLLAFEVSDDGVGFDREATRQGTGLHGMADRLDAVGGSLDVRSEPGAGTTIAGRLPTEITP